MKYRIVETITFKNGSLNGLTIENKTLIYFSKQEANEHVAERVGKTGGGGWLGSKYVVVSAKVVEEQ